MYILNTSLHVHVHVYTQLQFLGEHKCVHKSVFIVPPERKSTCTQLQLLSEHKSACTQFYVRMCL